MPPWSLGRRIAFRFAFVYFVGYMLPFPLGWLPGALAERFTMARSGLAIFVAGHVLHATVADDAMSGSGDKLIDWAGALALLLVAALATVVWSLVDRHRPRYGRLHRLLRIYVRYFIGIAMISYGVAKIFVTQMPMPTAMQLEQPVGDLSPMRLLWTFMGASPAYERFTGVAETLGGLLLLWRRTTTVGALVLVGVLVNVLALNLCYDVPVKLFLIHLLALEGFLLLPEARRLVDVLLLRRASDAPPREVVDRRALIAKWCVKTALLAWIGYFTVANTWADARAIRDVAAQPAWAGDWQVDDYAVDGRSVPPLLTESERWRALTLVSYGEFAAAAVRRMDDERLRFRVADDAKQRTLTFSKHDRSEPPFTLRQTAVVGDRLTLEGDRAGRHLVVTLRRAPPRRYLLLERGFHWVTDVPFNR